MGKDTHIIRNSSCYGLKDVKNDSIDAVITDPPYGISFQNNHWDKNLPDSQIWKDTLSVLKPGGFGLVFTSIKLMHRIMVHLEDSGLMIKDVLFWSFLNGMPKSRNLAIDIDKELGAESQMAGVYQYVQGYKKGGANSYKSAGIKFRYEPTSKLGQRFKGAGLSLKPAYEPIIMIQKPLEDGLSVAQNMIKYGTGALNIEESRIPYEKGESKVGHNPHPKGRVPSNIIRTQKFEDGYDKFFLVPKVRQGKDKFNHHPTLKPVELMEHLVKLVSFGEQTILDPFMGSGSTGVAATNCNRKFIGYELDKGYFDIANTRLKEGLTTNRTTTNKQKNKWQRKEMH